MIWEGVGARRNMIKTYLFVVVVVSIQEWYSFISKRESLDTLPESGVFLPPGTP